MFDRLFRALAHQNLPDPLEETTEESALPSASTGSAATPRVQADTPPCGDKEGADSGQPVEVPRTQDAVDEAVARDVLPEVPAPALERGGPRPDDDVLSATDAPLELPQTVESAPLEPAPVEPAPTVEPPPADEPWREAGVPARRGRRRGRRLAKPEAEPRVPLTAQQRLLILDTWHRSGLPAGDFAALVGLSKHTLYGWKRRFQEHGPEGLMDQPRGVARGSKLSELTQRTILMLKQSHPEWGCEHISNLLLRGPALAASPSAVARVLHEAGYELEEVPTRPHPDQPRRFERAKPNQLWQTDLFTFVLKRQNRRVYLVAFLDDHSRFITSYGLHASQSAALVIEVLRAAIASYAAPEEVLTDNGAQYVTWRGKSAFAKELESRGIRQIVSRPRHPQTLGKIERFWGTLWRECVQSAIFVDLEDARRRIGWFIDHYNFQRPHTGLDGLVPADRFFGAACEVRRTLEARVAANALELARNGLPKAPFYVTGQVAGQPFSVHAEGERVILTRPGQPREEVDLVAPPTETSGAATLPDPLCPCGVPGADLPALPETPEDPSAREEGEQP